MVCAQKLQFQVKPALLCYHSVLLEKYVYNSSLLHSLQLLDITPGDQGEEEGGHMDLDAQRKGKAAVIKTSTRQVNPYLGEQEL